MGGGPSNTTQTTTPQIPRWLTGPGRDIVSSLMSTLFPGGNLQQYGPQLNQQIAGFNPLQTGAMSNIAGMQGDVQKGLGAAQGANQLMLDPNMLYAKSNPYLSANVDAMNQQITDAYKFGTAPSEMSNAVLGGAFGGSADAVTRLRDEFGLGQNLGATDLQAYQQNYENQLGRMQQATGMAPAIAQAQYMPSEMTLGIGGQQQQQSQNLFNTMFQNAWRQQNFPFQLLQQGVGILTPFLNAYSGSKTTAPNTMGK